MLTILAGKIISDVAPCWIRWQCLNRRCEYWHVTKIPDDTTRRMMAVRCPNCGHYSSLRQLAAHRGDCFKVLDGVEADRYDRKAYADTLRRMADKIEAGILPLPRSK